MILAQNKLKLGGDSGKFGANSSFEQDTIAIQAV